jgi:hypothetical protein
MNKQYRITPRNLGSLALSNVCLFCFWVLSAIRFRPPFDFGAAIFGDCQKMQEAMLGYYLQKNHSLPKQFAPFCDIKERVDVEKHWSKFGYTHKSGVWLYGSPDEVLRRSDDTIVIWDHKTAHPKHDQGTDKFRPQYEVQVTGYGLIAEEGLNLGRVSAGALGYWDVKHQDVVDDPGKFIKDGMLWAAFEPKVYEIAIDYSRIDKLLKEAIRIWNSKVPPEGNVGCDDCKKVQALFAIQGEIESATARLDDAMRSYSNNHPAISWDIKRRFRDRQLARWSALRETEDFEGELAFDENSIAANWEFPGRTAS